LKRSSNELILCFIDVFGLVHCNVGVLTINLFEIEVGTSCVLNVGIATQGLASFDLGFKKVLLIFIRYAEELAMGVVSRKYDILIIINISKKGKKLVFLINT
jgi:hypothetical protein